MTRLTLALLASSLLAACVDKQPVCVPKATAQCFCDTGGRGTQACTDDGYDYKSCTCSPDAAPADAAPDAP